MGIGSIPTNVDMATMCTLHHDMVPQWRGIYPSNTGCTRGIAHSFMVIQHVLSTVYCTAAVLLLPVKGENKNGKKSAGLLIATLVAM